MGHKFDPAKIDLLIGKERHKEMDPRCFLTEKGLSGGMSLADIGCGPGFFTFPAAEIVGKEGRVYAVDVQEEMLDEIRRRTPPENIVLARSGEREIPVEDGSCDMVLLAYVFHEAEDRPPFLEEIKRILKDSGLLILLDWEKRVEEEGPPYEERLAKREAETLLKGAGFEVFGGEMINPSQYCISARAG